MLELTTKCNLNCTYCFRKFLSSREITEIDLDIARAIIKKASKSGVKRIVLSGWGEPLTHPDILEVISAIKSSGMEVLLNTNGVLLEEYVRDIHRLRVDSLVVSIDSASDEIYSKLRLGGDLYKIVHALQELRELRIRGPYTPDLHIHFTVTKLNYACLTDVIKLAKDVGASHVVVSNVIPLSSDIEESLACYRDPSCTSSIEEVSYEAARLSLLYGISVLLPKFTTSVSERSCPFITKRAAFVRVDGLVTPCIYYSRRWSVTMNNITRELYPVVFGDLRTDELSEIWLSTSYVKFRVITYFMHEPSCLDCPLEHYCTLTLTNRYDCWGNSPTCAHCPYSRDIVRCPL